MPQPPAYNRTKDFTENFGTETDHSGLNAELDKVSNSINDVRGNLALLQADDGKLRPEVVTPESIAPALYDKIVDDVEVAMVAYTSQAQASAASAAASQDTASAAATTATAAAASAQAAAAATAAAPATVADYAALRAYNGNTASVQVTGYTDGAAPSGIAGLFVRDDDDTASADNGGTIIVDNNGRRWRRKHADGVNLAWFGVKGDGTTDDTTAIKAAISASDHVIWPVGRYRITSSLPLRSGLKMVALGEVLVENTRPSGYETAAFSVGNIGRYEINDMTYYGVAAPAAGAVVLTLTSPGHAANFAADDFVFVRGGSFYTEAGENFYEFGSVNRIASVNAGEGTVTLKYAMDEAVTNCEISNITQSGLNSSVTGDRLFAVEGAVLDGFSVKVPAGAPVFREGGGALNCTFRFKNVDCDSFAYGNAWAHSSIEADRVLFDRHLWEFGCNSHHVDVSVRYARMMTTSTAGKRPIRTGENIRQCRLKADFVDLSIYNINDVPIYVSNSRDCLVDINHLIAIGVTTRILTINSLAQTPTAPPCRGNTVRLTKAIGGTLQRYATFANSGGTLQDNAVVDSKFFGAVTSSAIQLDGARPLLRNVNCEAGALDYGSSVSNESVLNCHFPAGVAPAFLSAVRSRGRYRGNTDDGLLVAVAQNKFAGFSSITSTSAANAVQAQSFPAGSLRAGDVLRYEIAGEVPTAGGTTKSLEAYINSTKVMDIQYGASEIGDFAVSGQIVLTDLKTTAFSFICPSGATGSPQRQTGAITVSSVAENTLGIEFRAYRGGEGGDLFIRHFRAWIERHGA